MRFRSDGVLFAALVDLGFRGVDDRQVGDGVGQKRTEVALSRGQAAREETAGGILASGNAHAVGKKHGIARLGTVSDHLVDGERDVVVRR